MSVLYCAGHYQRWRRTGDPGSTPIKKHPRRTSEKQRFWASVNKSGRTLQADLGTCWEWTGDTNRKGYGRFGRERTGVLVIAHRFSWELAHGDPGALWVLHRCDNPPCVRPDHLFLGTIDDNNDDMLAKRRNPRGEQHGQAKLTEEDVRTIRKMYAAGGLRHRDIAEMYGMDRRSIGDVINRVNWPHVD